MSSFYLSKSKAVQNKKTADEVERLITHMENMGKEQFKGAKQNVF